MSNHRHTFLDDDSFAKCLKMEVNFLKSGDTSLLIDPQNIYVRQDNMEWSDLMAYLQDDAIDVSYTRKQSQALKKNKSLLKCGFVFSGWPKKIWAINIQTACIDSDDQGNIWFQIGDDMLLTSFEDLSKFRKAVQLGFEYGQKNPIVGNSTPIQDILITSDNNDEDTTNNKHTNPKSININQGVYCCAGELCGMKGINNGFIIKEKIQHKCVKCNGVMHGGICGAEASTILTTTICGHMDVICFVCMNAHNNTCGMYFFGTSLFH